MLWLLDKKGADVNAMTGSGATALCIAPTVDIVNALMDRGANPIMKTSKGYTPLMAYSSFKQIASVARLLRDPRVRANINVRNQYGHTALHLACQSEEEEGKLATVTLLLRAGAIPHVPDNDLMMPVTNLEYRQPTHRATIALLRVYPDTKEDAEKASFLVKTRTFVVAAASSTALTSSCMKSLVARGQSLPHVELAAVTGANKNTKERRRQFSNIMAFLVGMEVGPKGAAMQRDVFRVVLDYVMPIWDPLRGGIAGSWPSLEGGNGDKMRCTCGCEAHSEDHSPPADDH